MNTRKLLYLAMICLSVFASGLPAHAGMVGTEQFQPLTAPSGIEAQRDWIVEQLQKGGVQAPMAAERVAAMTDAEVAQVYQHFGNPAHTGTAHANHMYASYPAHFRHAVGISRINH